MKLFCRAVLLLGIGTFLCSCGKEVIQIKPILPERIVIIHSGGIQKVTFYKNERWTVTSTQGWCRVSAYMWQDPENSSVLVECEPNLSYSERSSKVTINVKGVIETFLVKQTGIPYSVSLDRTLVSLAEGQQCRISPVFKPIDASVMAVEWSSDDEKVAKVSPDGVVEAVKDGRAVVTMKTEDGKEAVCSVKVTVPMPLAVDLGLSVKWASFNIGADRPEGYGDYYSWGEVSTYYEPGFAQSESPDWKYGKAAGYDWPSYRWCSSGDKPGNAKLSKYNFSVLFGTVDNKDLLDLDDDVAHVKLGDSWRIPTIGEWKELIENCTWEWAVIDSVSGCKVSGKKPGYTGNSIFLPAAGYRRYHTYVPNLNFDGDYWSSCLGSGLADYPLHAWYVYFKSEKEVFRYCNYRCDGRSVRAVCTK